MAEENSNVLTNHYDKKKIIQFFVIMVVTAIVWNLPIDTFGIDGLTIVQQRIIAIFVFATLSWAQEHILTLRTERPYEVARQQHIETRLGSGGSQDKSSKEEHDGGVGEGRHDMLRVHQFADVLTLEGHQRIVRNGQTHDGDDSERSSPRGNTLRQPRQGSEHKDRDDALLKMVLFL